MLFYLLETIEKAKEKIDLILFDFECLTPLSAIFQLYHVDQF